MEIIKMPDNKDTTSAFSFAIGGDYETLNGIMEKCKVPGEYEVEFKVNGTEIPFSKFINALYDKYDQLVKLAAINQQEESLDRFQDVLTDFENEITDILEMFREKKKEIVRTMSS